MSQVLQDLPDNLRFFYERNYTHGAGAFGADQRVDLVDLLYKPGPGAAGGPSFGGLVLYDI